MRNFKANSTIVELQKTYHLNLYINKITDNNSK